MTERKATAKTKAATDFVAAFDICGAPGKIQRFFTSFRMTNF